MGEKRSSVVLKDLAILALLFGTLFFSFLGNRPLAAPDEGRYVEIPREMVQTGDYITPRLNGLVYFEKPPLFYWMETLPLRIAGIQEGPLRIPVAFLALLGCLITYFFTQRIYGRTVGLWSSSLLGTMLLYQALGRLITLDMALSVFVTGSLFSFLTATEESNPLKRRSWMFFSAIFGAGAVLSKGLVALVLPSLIIGLWVMLSRKWALLRFLFLPSSTLLFLLLIAPWHVLVSLKNPGFLDFYFIHEHFSRYLTTVHNRFQPLWFFIPIVLLGTFPWTSFLLRPFRMFFPTTLEKCRKSPMELFFLLWVLVPFTFFSVSHSKLIPYILPIFPPLAVLVAISLQKSLATHKSLKGEIFSYSLLCFLILGGLTFFLIKVDPSLIDPLRPFLPFLYGILGGGAVFIPLLRLWKGERIALYGIFTTSILFFQLVIQMAPHIPRLSIKPLALKFLETMPKETKVFTYIGYYQDLPPYLGRTVQIVEWHGELLYGAHADPSQQQIVSYQAFQEAWKKEPWACVFCRQDRYQELLKLSWFTPTLLGEHDGQVLACNRLVEKASL